MLKEDTQDLATHYETKFVWQALLDYKSYIFALISMCNLIPVYVLMLFLPTIIKSLGEISQHQLGASLLSSAGYSSANAQLMTAPPFILACLMTILGEFLMILCKFPSQQSDTVGYLSDKFNLRGPFIIGGSIVSLVGYIILITETSPAVGYVGTFIAASGVFPTVAVHMAWISSSAGGEVRKGVLSFFCYYTGA